MVNRRSPCVLVHDDVEHLFGRFAGGERSVEREGSEEGAVPAVEYARLDDDAIDAQVSFHQPSLSPVLEAGTE